MVKLHRISLVERYIFESKDLTLEAKKDLEDLKDYLGDDLFDAYMKIRDKISDPNFKDFSKLKKMDKKDIQDFVSSFQSKSSKRKSDKTEGAEKIYEDDEWVVYKITTYPAAQLYGKGTKWCITGRYPGHEERGEGYFNSYIRDNNLDGGYYFYLNKKDPSEKYCVLQTKNKEIHSIWDAEDTDRGTQTHLNDPYEDDLILPEIPEVNLKLDYENPINYLCYLIKKNKSPKEIDSFIKNVLDKNDDYLIDYYSDADEIPIILACKSGNPEIVKVLLDNGADPNGGDDDSFTLTSIYTDDWNKEKEIMKMLIDAGADINYRYNNYYETPIFKISNYGGVEKIKFLIENGADINAKNDQRETPLIKACSKGNLEVAKALIEAGADVNARDIANNNPLAWAVIRGNPNLVKLLLDKGADVDVIDADGYTPIMYALDRRYSKDTYSIIKMLLDHNANTDIAYNNGKSLVNRTIEPEVKALLKASRKPTV